jgi:hypothetical protein
MRTRTDHKMRCKKLDALLRGLPASFLIVATTRTKNGLVGKEICIEDDFVKRGAAAFDFVVCYFCLR